MKNILVLVSLVSVIALADKEGGCPSLAGYWGCELYINGGHEPIHNTINVTEKDLSSTSKEYDLGGNTLIASWEKETVNGGSKTRCINEKTLLSWYREKEIDWHHVYYRSGPKSLRIEILRLVPYVFDNNQTVYDCHLLN